MSSEFARRILLGIKIAVVGVALSACSDRGDSEGQAVAQIQASHIETNTPERAQFARVLQRDLAVYFLGPSGDPSAVEFEMLRDGPTQSGVAYPKFYVWARAKGQGVPEREGAVRLAAIDRTRFEVTDFLSVEEISANPSRIYEVFPRPVCERIAKKMQR